MQHEERNHPTFLVIGAAKSGTTSLCDGLRQHPQVFITDPKEPHYFSAHYDSGWDWYSSLFEPAGNEKALGEGSISYSMDNYQPAVARRIARDLPDVKLIYIVRHPLRRIESGWRHLLTTNRTSKDFADALRDFPRLVTSSLYWRQISYYRTHFPDDRILVLFFEDFIDSPRTELQKCYRFLGVDSAFDPPDTGASNVSQGQWMWPIGALLRAVHIPRSLQPPRRVKEMVKTAFLSRFGSDEKKPSWPPDLEEKTLKRIRPDATRFLRYFGKPTDFWDLGDAD